MNRACCVTKTISEVLKNKKIALKISVTNHFHMCILYKNKENVNTKNSHFVNILQFTRFRSLLRRKSFE